MKLALLLLLLAEPARAAADDEWSWRWSRGDMAWEGAFAAVVVVDWLQTLEFTQHPERNFQPEYAGPYEANPLLGARPSRAKVNTLIPLGIIGHAAVTALLPHGIARDAWQVMWIAVEAHAVGVNYSTGVRIRW